MHTWEQSPHGPLTPAQVTPHTGAGIRQAFTLPPRLPLSLSLCPSQVHIQRLELALLCFTCLELFLTGATAVMACRDDRLSAEVRNPRETGTWSKRGL